jgi:hypothetical protein
METNYVFKHKCLLVPLKAVLLVFVMLLVGFTTFAQTGKSVRVTNDEQLIEAMANPSVTTIELSAGYYAYLDYNAEDGNKVIKQGNGDGSRGGVCTYFIIDGKFCFYPGFDDPDLPVGYSPGNAAAGTDIAFCVPPGSDCCPPPESGYWTVSPDVDALPSPTANVIFVDPINAYFMKFGVNEPGRYLLRYVWPATNSYAQTEYYFYGPELVEFSAPDVCGTETELTFNYEPGYSYPGYPPTITWTIDDIPYGNPIAWTGPSTSGTYPFSVPECGTWKIYVTVTNLKTPAYVFEGQTIPAEYCTFVVDHEVEFSCTPVADAGPDVNVCNELCVSLNGTVTVLGEISPSFAYSWINIGGPDNQELTFSPDNGVMQEDVTACADELADCPYGEYEVQLQVQNGECYDDDNALVRFYEQPDANAGPDQHLCNIFTFNLAAVPYVYCGTEGVNYWSESYWEVVGEFPAGAVTIVDPLSPVSQVIINSALLDCEYGPYTFRWNEENSKGANMGGCFDFEDVVVTIYEDPAPDAGDDFVLCNTFAFSLWGIGDAPCYENTVVQYHWEKTAEPGNCDTYIYDNNDINPDIVINNCDPAECQYGMYTFELTQCNGYMDVTGGLFQEVCCTTDEVNVWILEEPAADAGPDEDYCFSFEFNLAAVPTPFCGEEDVNYFTWGVWELVSGPAAVVIDDVNDPNTAISIDDADPCPYGSYVFKWTEYNGFGTPFQGCVDEDFVTIVVTEQPEVLAGDDFAFCNTFNFQLDGTVDETCDQLAYQIEWTLEDQPGACYYNIMDPNMIDPYVTISNECGGCPYGEYIFKVVQRNGYYVGDAWVTVCEDEDFVSVWIYEQPANIDAGPDQDLCDVHTFDLSGTGYDYCGVFGVNYNNWYEWTLVSQPAGSACTPVFTDPDGLMTSVTLNCTGTCPYGEFVFRLTEYNGTELVYCEAYDEVSIFIFETPLAEPGADFAECVDLVDAPYCGTMGAELDYCYSMYGVWTKSCGPGTVVFENVNDPATDYCISEPGRYKFIWTVWNDAEGCMDDEEIVFDLIEQPTASAEITSLVAECDTLCTDLGMAFVNKYEYYGVEWNGTDEDACPNYWDNAYWSFVAGPGNVTFADDTDPNTDLCVSLFGCYTVRWNEVNKSIDGEVVCSDYVDIFVQFVETPEPDAGDDASICDKCYTMTALPYVPENCAPTDVEQYWMFYNYVPPVDPCPTDEFSIQYTYAFTIYNVFSPTAQICVMDDCLGTHYGTYGFIWVNQSGDCIGYDTVYIEFKKAPEELALEGMFDPSNCDDGECPNCWVDCLYPDEEVIEVCANTCLNLGIDWDCFCYGGPIPGYTYEWSFIGPAGSYMSGQPYWYDCDDNCWRGSDDVFICFGECCDTARLYLTITTPQGCTTTEEWKFYVKHLPCAEIDGPAIAEVGSVTEYCNVCPEEYDMSCLLYTWTAEHCGEIVGGQGTECIEVLWTDYNANGGWGEITLTVFDTCTGCCAFDYMNIQMYPEGTLGEATLSGQVFYRNNGNTPLNGVTVTLKNGDVPVMTTETFVKFVDADPPYTIPGYYEFTGIDEVTPFGLEASYDATWYGANATDALAVELRAINGLPGGNAWFVDQPLQEEAMDVNDNASITATDALWIKQRAINMVNYFPAGNWAFTPNMITPAIAGYNFYALNMGDANRSNVPNSNKSMPAIDLVNDGIMNVVNGQVFDLPIRVAKANQFGAIQLDLEYNASLLEVVEVTPVEGMLYNVSGGNVYIAYSNPTTMVLADNDVVVTLKVKAIGEIASTESLFSIGINSQFADAQASVIEPVTLKTFGITTDPAAVDYFLSANRPNPFSTSTFIEYTMPESGKVKLTVLDMLGQELEVLVEATQTAGTYSVEYSAAGLATGVYLYKITVDGETRDFISTQRMVVSK